MDNGWSTGQDRQEDAARDRTFRLPQMQETLPSRSQQTKDLALMHGVTRERHAHKTHTKETIT